MNAVSIPETATVVAAPDVLASEFSDEVVILNLSDGIYYSLDKVGARVWSLLKSPIRVGVIRDVIVSEFEVDESRCLNDLRDLLVNLLSRGLVSIQ
jgi:hypothetical protein